MNKDKVPYVGQIFDVLLRAVEQQHGREMPFNRISYRRLLGAADLAREALETGECLEIKVPFLDKDMHLETVLCKSDFPPKPEGGQEGCSVRVVPSHTG